MIKKLITLFKLGRKIAKSDILNITSKFKEPPLIVKIFFKILSFSFSPENKKKNTGSKRKSEDKKPKRAQAPKTQKNNSNHKERTNKETGKDRKIKDKPKKSSEDLKKPTKNSSTERQRVKTKDKAKDSPKKEAQEKKISKKASQENVKKTSNKESVKEISPTPVQEEKKAKDWGRASNDPRNKA